MHLPRPRLLRLRLRSQNKIPWLNLRHSRRLPRLKTLKSRRYRPSCVAIPPVPSVRAMASQLKRNVSQCALFAANEGTMLWIVGTNWTRTKPTRLGQGGSPQEEGGHVQAPAV